MGVPLHSFARLLLIIDYPFGAQEVSDYLVERAEQPWMHDLLVMCDELKGDDVNRFRSRGTLEVRTRRVDSEENSHACALPAKASGPGETADWRALTLDALRWATGLKGDSIVVILAQSLPHAVIEEQIQLYENRSLVPKPTEPEKIFCNPNKLTARMKVCRMLYDQLCSRGLDPRGRMPHNFIRDALASHVRFSSKKYGITPKLMRNVRNWYSNWLADGGPDMQAPESGRPAGSSSAFCVSQRLRRHGGGRLLKNNLIREELYAWFVAMRYSIDWKALEDQRRSSGAGRKCMGRFPRRLLVAKVSDLLARHCHESLVVGTQLEVFRPTNQWFRGWQKEYGLSMLKPNRKYKVPKRVLEERLKLWWISVFRIRAFCLSFHGYDPEMENWDQSPFHNNESGSQNIRTLAVKGREVPLIEGHDDTRERWTANFTTWSNKQRIMNEGPPTASCASNILARKWRADCKHISAVADMANGSPSSPLPRDPTGRQMF